MIKQLKTALLATCLLSGSFSAIASQNAGYSLQELVELKYNDRSTGDPDKDKENSFRRKAMKDAAMSVGAQNGYVSRIQVLKSEILEEQESLDNLFDFSLIMKLASEKFEEMHLLPPVLRRSENIIQVSESATRIEVFGVLYEIIKPARLVSIAPNWRQYLIYDQGVQTNKPADILLPRTNQEQKDWSVWVQEGWSQGIAQAEREMTFRSRKLKQDFIGMIIYSQELTKGKVLKPFVSSSHEEVAGGHNRMIEDKRIIQLAMPAKLNPDASNWEPLLMDTRGSLRANIENKHYSTKIR